MSLSYVNHNRCNSNASQKRHNLTTSPCHSVTSRCDKASQHRNKQRLAQCFAQSHGVTSPLSFDGRLRHEGDISYYALAIKNGVQVVCFKSKRAYVFGGVA